MADRKSDKDAARATQEILRIGGATKSTSARTPIIGDGDEAVTEDVLLIYGADRGIKIGVIYQ